MNEGVKILSEAPRVVEPPCQPKGIEERRLVGTMLIRGYSAAAIAHRFGEVFGRDLDFFWLRKLHRKVQTSGKLREIAAREEAHILTSGLAKKAERVRRLSEYVEALEVRAMAVPEKVGIEYRRGIAQIKEEVEGLGLDITIHPGDAWGQLLAKIEEAGRRVMEQVDAGAGIPDPEPAGDNAE